MLAPYCNPLQESHKRRIDKLYEFYNNTKLKEIYGEYIIGGQSSVNDYIRDNIRRISWDRNKKPLESFIPEKNNKLIESFYKQIERGIKNWEESVTSGTLNGFEALYRAPVGIYHKDPNLTEWNRKIILANNVERQNQTKYASKLSSIADRLKNVFLASTDGKLTLRSASKELAKLSDDYWAASINGDGEKASEIHNRMNDILSSDDSKQVLNTFVNMMENFSRKDIDVLISNPERSRRASVSLGMRLDIMHELFGIVKDSKDLMNDMGNVNINGLKKTIDIIDTVFTGQNLKDHPLAVSHRRTVNEAISRMEEAIKQDKYFPHYGIESLLSLEEAMDQVNFLKFADNDTYTNRAMKDIMEKLTLFTQETLASHSNDQKRQMFEMDPIKVMETYSKNAIAYNKKQFVTDAFLKAIQDIKPRQANFDGMEKAIEYLSHKYMAINNGFIDASSSIKAASALISRAQTMSKMGLSLTGALRNSTQWFWYGVQSGFRRYRRGKKAMKSNFEYDFGNRKLKMGEMISESKRADESGYFFDNLSNISLETISKGALFNVDGVPRQSIKFDYDDNGAPIVRYQKDGLWRKFDLKMAELAGKSLIFHRKTENWVRKAVYENSFAEYFSTMYNNSDYMNRQIEQKGREKAMEDLRSDAHNIAMNWVISTQFEYSTAGRALMYGGGTTNASVIGNSVFQFFPYASNMFEYNNRIIRDGWHAMRDGDFKSFQFGAAARLIGFQTMVVGLAAILFNNEFKYIIENDTYSRLEKLFTLMKERNTEKTFGNGIAAILSGPVVSDMLFWMEVGGLTDFSNNEIAELALGYYDYANKADTDQNRMMINRASVSFAKLYKSRESFARGDIMSILRNQLLAYPSDFTRTGHEYLMNTLGIETSRRQRKSTEDRINETILNLPEEQRENILRVVRSLREESTQTDRGIPAGLENLTIR